MVNLLSTALNGAGDLRSVDPRALLGHVTQLNTDAADPEGLRSAAIGLGAGLYVLGDILDLGERIRIDAALYSTERGTEAIAPGTAEGNAAQISELVDDLATQLLAGQRLGPGGRITRLASVTTNSLDALKAYLEGEMDFRQGRDNRGVEGFQRAVAVDSAFALAYYRMSIAAAWAGRTDLAHVAVAQATAYKDRLSERDVRLLEALRAFLHGNFDVAESLYRASVSTYPDDVEAWYMLGETLIHFGSLRGRSMTESREAFETLLRFEPDHQSGLFHLAQVALREGRLEELDSLTTNYVLLYPGAGVASNMLAMRMTAFGDTVAREGFWSMPTTDDELRGDLREVFLLGRDLATARGITARRLETVPSRDFRAFAHIQMAHLEMGGGRWTAAQAQLDSAGLLDPGLASLHRAFLLQTPYVEATDAELAAAFEQLQQIAARGQSGDPTATYEEWYLLGLLAARLGREGDARRHAADLEERSDSLSYEGTLAFDFAVGIRAALARRSAQPRDELAILEQATLNKWYGFGGGDAFTNRVIQRFRRGELLQVLDRRLEATQWLGSIADITIEESAYIGPSLVNSGEIYEELGDTESAQREYNLFLKLWEDADPEFQSLVNDVRSRVARLAGGRN
jgi:tetratricopeptide (TPR) repeat protein